MSLTRRHASRSRSEPRLHAARAGLALGLLAAAAGSGACAKARAETAPDGPPLVVPAAPPRVLAPIDEPEPVLVEIPEEPPAPEAPAPVRTPPRRPAETRTEAAPEAAPAPAEPAATDTRELRATPTTASVVTERGVRDLLSRAARDLGRISYARLSADGRDQYDQSKRFSEQAEAALRGRNIVFAATLADKAATLAAELVAR